MESKYVGFKKSISPTNCNSCKFAVVCEDTRNPISPTNCNMTQFGMLEFDTFNVFENQYRPQTNFYPVKIFTVKIKSLQFGDLDEA